MVTLDEFARITRNVIARDGFDDYLPTAYYPSRKHIVVLEGVPRAEALEPIAIRWAANGAVGDEEYLVAFRVGPSAFKIIRREAGATQEAVFDAVVGDV